MLIALLALAHGAIHLMGFVKAYGLAEISSLHQPISRPIGLLWLVAAVLFLLTAVLLVLRSVPWWMAATPAIVLSQTLIFMHWHDAWFGTVANVVLLVPLTLSLLDLRPGSFPSAFRRLAADVVAPAARSDLTPITEADLGSLPPVVQAYLRYTGVVGKPRVASFRVRFTGGLRSTPQSAWMPSEAVQVSAVDPPARLFLVESRWHGVPFAAFHRYEQARATMQVRLLSTFGVVDARGREMDQSETVTVFNDMCLLAPASLVGAAVHWTAVDERTVDAAFTNGGQTIRARLTFGADGALQNFVSSDRYRSTDGRTYDALPWSTPVHAYAWVDGRRVPTRADATWTLSGGAFTYARFELVEIEYNLGAGVAAERHVARPWQEARHERANIVGDD